MLVKIYKYHELWILAALVIIGIVLRAYNINWDSGMTFHPDERNIDAAVSRIHLFDNLNPEFFAYGGLPVYVYRGTAQIISGLTLDTTWLTDWGKINVIGRSFSALFSTFTIIAVYKLGTKLFGMNVGILASLFTTFAPSLIQTAHFAITENFLTLTVVLICLGSLKILETGKLRFFVLTGLVWGLALAAKTSGISFAVIPFTAIVLSTFQKPIRLIFLLRNFLFGIVYLLVAIGVFITFSPYTLITWDKFLESMRYESGVVSGSLLVPYVLQFVKTTPFIFQSYNLFWQMGLVVVAVVFGFALIGSSAFRKKDKRLFIFLVFPIIYFMYVGTWHTKFIRYMLPLIPFFVISGSYTLVWIEKHSRKIGEILIVFFVATSVLWGLAFFSIYTKPQTRIVASKWIFENITPGSRILGEHWDDGLPVHLSSTYNQHNFAYDIDQLTIYDTDNSSKASYLARELSSADYVILSSRRLYGTLMNLPERFPIVSQYYKLLFAGELGYSKVAEFSSYPSIFGFSINDDASEETFQVYDHPKVIVFKNEYSLSEQEIRRALLIPKRYNL